jgi:hypothetical protein
MVRRIIRRRYRYHTTSGAPKANGFDAAAEKLCTAFDASPQGLLFRDPSDDVDMRIRRVLGRLL